MKITKLRLSEYDIFKDSKWVIMDGYKLLLDKNDNILLKMRYEGCDCGRK